MFGELSLGILRNKFVMMEFQVMYYVPHKTRGVEGKKENKVRLFQKLLLKLRSLCPDTLKTQLALEMKGEHREQVL